MRESLVGLHSGNLTFWIFVTKASGKKRAKRWGRNQAKANLKRHLTKQCQLFEAPTNLLCPNKKRSRAFQP